ncbi:MAG: histidine--tRNA ligase [Pseudomonadota bacterium]|jgi:histidyl-tRNA synthetase|nr:histidine--tRNA ligase [Alphaproteobacteria bacterium]
MTKLQPVRGTRDFLGDLARCVQHIQETAFSKAQCFGFERIDTPIFEYTGVFKRAVGETSDIVGKEMYTFLDRGGEEITLRPEGTAPVVRAILSNSLTQQLPLKYCYYGPMFRYERPQRGRYRQLHQFGVEFFGIDNPYADVEVIDLARQIIKELGINAELYLNTIGDVESRDAYRAALVEYFSKYKNELSEDSQQRLTKNPMRILDSKDANDKRIAETAPKIAEYLTASAAQFFGKIREGLEEIGIKYTLDSTLVRGLDYYTHTAFEFKSSDLGAQDAILGGGRYDGLVQHMGGPFIPAVGWGMGVDRMALLLENKVFAKPTPVAFVTIGDYQSKVIKLATTLREQGITCEIIYKANPGKAFKEADKLNARFVVVVGEEEMKTNTVKIKDLNLPLDHPQKECTIKEEDLFNVLNQKNG